MGERRVVVVGAGIIGLTIGFELARRGAHVEVIDKGQPGSGASSAANGALTPHSDHSASDLIANWALESVEKYPAHLERLKRLTGRSVDIDPGGVIEVFLNDDDVAQGKPVFDEMHSKGWPVTWLTSSDVLDLETNVNPAVTAGIHYTVESAIDVSQLITATVDALSVLGCTIRSPTTAVAITAKPTGGVSLETTTGALECDTVVLSSGAEVCKVEGLPSLAMRRIRGEILEAWGPPGMTRRCLYRGDGFVTPRRDGRLLLGTSYEPHVPGMDENTSTISIAGALQTLSATVQILPALSSCELRRVWKGWRPATSDLQPVVGPYGSADVVLAMGFAGLGYTLAVAAADAVARLILEDEDTPLLQALSPNRPGLEFEV